MAADWRGWRLIVVNGEQFRWQENAWDGVRVRPEVDPGRLLLVPQGRHAVPSLVAEWIEAAIARGWLTDIPRMQLLGVDGSRIPLEAVPLA
jgi:hypothetical protein